VAVRRGLGVVFLIIGVAVFMSFSAMVLMYLAVGREPAVSSGSTLVLRIGGELAEMPPENVVGSFFRGTRPPTLRGIVNNIRKAKSDSRVNGLLIVPTTIEDPFWAKTQEIRDAIVDFRKSGKPAVAYLEYGGDKEYYLATACDRIFLLPSSPLNVAGLVTFQLFLRGTLDKIGAYPDMHHIGEYKTASNQLTEKGYTKAHREMDESLNRDLYDQVVRAIADSRKKSEDEVRALIDSGPFLPEEALRAGLVDDLAYEDQIDDKVKFGSQTFRRLEEETYSSVSLSSLGLNRGPRIAVLYAAGIINTGKSAYDPLNGPVVGSDTLVQYIRQIRGDDSLKAIILRIDSPGGSSVASDVIWRELVLMRDRKPERPLIASMSDLAASGGYYIAMAAQQVVAQPATLTGSIGIYGGKVVTGGVFNKLGANIESVKDGKNAEMYAGVRPFSPTERAKLEEQLQAFYDQFVEKVAEARHTTPEKIDAVGQGRVWTGSQARQIGLVDAIGGLDRAVALAKQRAKIPQDQEVEIVSYPPRRSFYEIVSDQLAGGESVGLGSWLAVADRAALSALFGGPTRLFRRGEPLALMPQIFLR
jgi:protease IV